MGGGVAVRQHHTTLSPTQRAYPSDTCSGFSATISGTS